MKTEITHNELIGLREYINYISNRISYLKIFTVDIPCGEYKYYCLLRKRIKQWGETHIIFYKYLVGEIDMERAKALYGVSERQFYRISTQQRKKLIVYIEEQEVELSKRFPFIPMENIFGRHL